MDIFSQIQSIYPGFTKSEKKVASFILSEKQGITNLTLMDIALGAGVSEASVLRFCNKLGIKKLIDLKIQIAKDAEIPEEEETNIYQKLKKDFTDIIEHTASLVDGQKVRQAVDYIEQADRVYFYGVAASGLCAQIAEDNFIRIGKDAHAKVDSHFQIMTSATMTPKDVVIVFSLSGNTKDTCESTFIARENGAKIIAITSYKTSQLAKIADVVLLTSAEENIINGGRIVAHISQLYVLDCLKREFTARNTAQVAALKENLGKAVIAKKL